MPMSQFLDAVNESVVMSLDSTTLTLKYYQVVQLKFLKHNTKFHPNELISVPKKKEKKKPTGFALYWLCGPSQGQGHWKWSKLIQVNQWCLQAWCTCKTLVEKLVCNVQCKRFCLPRQPAGQTSIQVTDGQNTTVTDLDWARNSSLVVCWSCHPAWCSATGSILLWGQFFQ